MSNSARVTGGSKHVETDDSSARAARPIGITLLALLNLTGGVYLGGGRVLEIADLSLDGPITLSGPFIVVLVGEIVISLIAVASTVGLFLSAKWGWWLASIYWSWRLCREVVFPLSAALVINEPVGSLSVYGSDYSRMASAFMIQGVILWYLFSATVFEYFHLERSRKAAVLIAVIGAGFLLSDVVHVLKRNL